MNKNLIILLIGGAAIYFFIKKKKTEFIIKKYKVIVSKNSRLNVRIEPNTNSSIITYLYSDQIIYATDYNDQWVIMSTDGTPTGIKGYVSKQYLTEVN